MKQHPTVVKSLFTGGLLLAVALTTSRAGTVAWWNFDQGTPGASFAGGGSGGVAAVPDLSGNGHWMYAWDDYWGPEYSLLGETPSGYGLSSRHSGHDDGYTLTAINAWTPLQWTIEVSLKLDDLSGWKTFIGRDGSTGISGDLEAAFYFQKNGIDNKIRLNFSTLGGQRYILDTTLVPVAGKWYHVAAVSDGSTLLAYADFLDGQGFQLIGQLALNPNNDNSLRATGNWTFGRGWWNGNFVDHIVGNLDNIRFSDAALPPSELLIVPEPSSVALLGLAGLAGMYILRRRAR